MFCLVVAGLFLILVHFRDGIEVLTGCRVVSVKEDSIIMNKKSTGETCLVLAGMVVWSTGVDTRPVIKDFMEHVGQGNRRVLEIDEWLCVKGCNDVFAIGDCATIDQRKVMVRSKCIISILNVGLLYSSTTNIVGPPG
ncbi:hypothetical protein Droror1_Dr00024136 [Drosera rotundifolia]